MNKYFKQHLVVSWLLVINIFVFISDVLIPYGFFRFLGMSRVDLISLKGLYQPFTYMFVHSTDNFLHILFNMFLLFMFGRDLEELLGSKRFIFYYLVSGIFGGLFHIIFSPFPVVGASGAIFGLMLAYAVSWPNRKILVFFLFPIKIKFFVIVLAVMNLLMARQGGGNIAYWAHLGGLAGGSIMLVLFRKIKVFDSLSEINRKHKMKKHKALIDARIREKEKVDLLLDKISDNGIDSLSYSEKKFLDKASSKYYQDSPPK